MAALRYPRNVSATKRRTLTKRCRVKLKMLPPMMRRLWSHEMRMQRRPKHPAMATCFMPAPASELCAATNALEGTSPTPHTHTHPWRTTIDESEMPRLGRVWRARAKVLSAMTRGGMLSYAPLHNAECGQDSCGLGSLCKQDGQSLLKSQRLRLRAGTQHKSRQVVDHACPQHWE